MHEAQVVTMELPHGQECLWYRDINVVAFAPHLDAAGRERALDAHLAQVRESLRPAAVNVA